VDDGARRTADREGVVEEDAAGAAGLAAAPLVDGRRVAERVDAAGAGVSGVAAALAGARRCAARGAVRTTGASDDDCDPARGVGTCDGTVRTVGARRWAGAVRMADVAGAGLVRADAPALAGADLDRAVAVDREDVEPPDVAGRAGTGVDRGAGADRVCGADLGAGADRGAGADCAGAWLGARRGCA
jgi:hypothetical protein